MVQHNRSDDMTSKLNTILKCGRCGGDGVADIPIASRLEDPCTLCEGRGIIPLGSLSYECNTCGATGQVLEQACSVCFGTGHLPFDYVIIKDMSDQINDIKEKVDEIKIIVDGL